MDKSDIVIVLVLVALVIGVIFGVAILNAAHQRAAAPSPRAPEGI